MSLRLSPFILAFLIFFSGIVSAQKLESRPIETGLALEVFFVKGEKPAHLPVSWSYRKDGGAWYGRFNRTSEGRSTSDRSKVSAVRLVPYIQGDAVVVAVSVLRGKLMDFEDPVASYVVRENQEFTAEALANFGVVPFELRVVRVAPAFVNPPAIVNQTSSLEVVSIEPTFSTFPRFKITARNLSTKNISALRINVVANGKIRMTHMPQGEDGSPLFVSGGYGEFTIVIPVNAEGPVENYSPVPLADQIVIASLVFDDGSYEGDVESAATYRGFVVGRKIEMRRLIPLLESAIRADATPDEFGATIRALDFVFDASELTPLVEAFPDLQRQNLKASVDIATHGVRRELNVKLKAFQEGSPSGQIAFRAWLAKTKDRYTGWLSRLGSDSAGAAQSN